MNVADLVNYNVVRSKGFHQLSNRTQWYISCNTLTPEMLQIKLVAFQGGGVLQTDILV